MLSGLQVSTKPVSSSTSDGASTITPDRIRRSACVRPFRKIYIEVAHNEGAGHLGTTLLVSDHLGAYNLMIIGIV